MTIHLNTEDMAQDYHLLVLGLYRGFMGRDPDRAGYQHWINKLKNGADLSSVVSAFLASPECIKKNSTSRNLAELTGLLSAAAQKETGNRKINIIDVGAQLLNDEEHIYAPLLCGVQSCRVVGFEPLDEKLHERKVVDHDSRVETRPVFIGDGCSHVFHMNQPSSTSSLLPFNEAVTSELVGLEKLSTISTQQVNTVTLDEAISDIDKIDFLKLDIQGFEYAALEAARHVLSRALVVHCEVSFIEIYQGQPLFCNVDQLMRSAGFRFIDFNHICRYPLKGEGANSRDQMGWGDAVYFKEADKVAPGDLLIQGLVALCIYNKFSLAEYLVAQYEQKTGILLNIPFGDRN